MSDSVPSISRPQETVAWPLRVNGTDHVVRVPAQTSLLHVIRNDLGLKAAKVGCDAARQCGACAVLCDGKEIPSCSTLISEVGGREITTAEGVGTRAQPTRIQLAFFEEQASQCGYCIPGMIIAATALLSAEPNPSDEQIKTGLDRHICRCGTHARILRAVQRAARNQPPLSPQCWPKVTTSVAPETSGSQFRPRGSLNPASSDTWIDIHANGHVTAYSGKMDMGTGVRTALIQIVAEELDVDIGHVAMVMSDTAISPDQGKSTASVGVAVGGQPLRVAACEIRAELIRRASAKLGVAVTELDTRAGMVFVTGQPERSVTYGELAADEPISQPMKVATQTHWGPELSGPARPKSREGYQYVGQSVKRDVVADHILGTFTHVHNVVVPGMLHGRVVLPPDYFARLICVDESSIAGLPGVTIVRRKSFLGVVAEREEVAIEAAKRLKGLWAQSEPLYDEQRHFEQMRHEAPVVAEQIGYEAGNVTSILATTKGAFEADFHCGYQLHAMLGPSCAVADVRDGAATIWSGTQWANGDRADIAKMLGRPLEQVRLIFKEAAGSYGRLGCDDAAADAALMSQIVGRPVRVQWSRRNENGWEPVGAAMTMKIRAALNDEGRIAAFDYTQWTSTHASAERGSHVAWNLLGTAPGYDRLEGYLHGLHYELENKRGRTVFLKPTLRTLYLRGPGSIQSHFAIESSIDELAARAARDPIEFRLEHLAPRDQEVLNAVAKLARWRPRPHPHRADATGAVWVSGRGVAYTRSGLRPTRVAVIIDLRVNRTNGQVIVDTVFMAHDCGFMVNPDGVLNQVQGNIIHALSRALFEEVHYTRCAITTLDWNTYGVIRFRNIPQIEVELIQRLEHEPAVVGETSSIPMIAAVANAIHDATGRRLRTSPFTPDRVLAALRLE